MSANKTMSIMGIMENVARSNSIADCVFGGMPKIYAQIQLGDYPIDKKFVTYKELREYLHEDFHDDAVFAMLNAKFAFIETAQHFEASIWDDEWVNVYITIWRK